MENEWEGVAVDLKPDNGSYVVKGDSVEEATLVLDDQMI